MRTQLAVSGYVSTICTLLIAGRNTNKVFPGLVQQKFRRVRLHFDVAKMLVRFSVNDPNLAVVLARIQAPVAHIKQLRTRIVEIRIRNTSPMA